MYGNINRNNLSVSIYIGIFNDGRWTVMTTEVSSLFEVVALLRSRIPHYIFINATTPRSSIVPSTAFVSSKYKQI